MKGVNSKIIKERSRILSEIVINGSMNYKRKWVGWIGKVNINIPSNHDLKLFQVRNDYYLPIYLNKIKDNNSVFIEIKEMKKKQLFGKILD